MDYEKNEIEIPFGASDSELHEFEYTIPEGYEAKIENGKVIVRKAESEDEKIRKGLINGFKFYSEQEYWGTEKFPLKIKDIIAWLEKQKDTLKDIEQKPEKCMYSKDNYTDEDRKVLCDGCEEECELRQKSEWSEEDDEYLEDTLTLLEGNRAKHTYGEVKNWLKSLRPQKQQEWSKEDIDMIDWLIRCCEKEHEELCNDRYGHQEIVSDLKRDCRKKWDWLESLKNKVAPQPQWKPTKEQMEELERASNGLRTDNNGLKVLRSLYEQLKAL